MIYRSSYSKYINHFIIWNIVNRLVIFFSVLKQRFIVCSVKIYIFLIKITSHECEYFFYFFYKFYIRCIWIIYYCVMFLFYWNWRNYNVEIYFFLLYFSGPLKCCWLYYTNSRGDTLTSQTTFLNVPNFKSVQFLN